MSKPVVKRRWQKTVIKVFYLIFIVGVTELLFSLPLFSRLLYERRFVLRIGNRPCNCYTSNPKNYFPETAAVQEAFTQHLANKDEFKQIYKNLYCIFYDYQKRKQGFFSERPRQAVIVGDSFCFGDSLKEEDTLGFLLGLKFTQLNVKNYGEKGVNVTGIYGQVVSALEHELPLTGIIYFYNLNDVLLSPEIASRQHAWSDLQSKEWYASLNPGKGIERFLAKSHFLRFISRTVILPIQTRLAVRDYLNMYFSPINKEELSQTLSLLVSMNRLAQEKKVNFCVVIYPLLYKDILGKYPFLPIHQQIKDFCRQYGIACVDAYEPFKHYYSLKRLAVHPVDYHPSGEANRLVVDYLSKQSEFWQQYQ